MPSLGWFNGPVTNRSTPVSVRNRQGTWKVSTPWPKWLIAGACVSASAVMVIAASTSLPSQLASKPDWHSSSQPCALAIASGRQRYA
ncbi:hypothetical protein IXO159_06190 [Xanthomonas oryzae pv. oryzae]|uniref:Uncharacterized protein n=1 Tax=Xanthomonas oryzae pv. oryzae TaxID=64187 RepID=A0A854CKX3_XANOO|nr:hypothetical protein BXO2_18055 [Xanthomonas oryzae pv. oryzae]OLG47819.1 hypothetical protein BXO25_07215 [Xanthomonas oryzae pv. oryzae]OLG54844.1 hypothetical protein BXO407_20335 [Xanthomonas oryzae pv. oryzae]OLG56463.1 hypothetical protein BXO34_02750 [Xanthomonas oryzae pv. oryzae]OLG64380.1 hypothetical protein BXO439_14495 [Xanthomonas oryzae pv. oryzae]